jgi:hypothetical protein
LKKIFLTDLKYVHRITRKEAQLVARKAHQQQPEEGHESGDSCISSEMSDTDDEAGSEVFF